MPTLALIPDAHATSRTLYLIGISQSLVVDIEELSGRAAGLRISERGC